MKESGRSSDSGIFASSHFGIAFEEKTLNLPKSSFLPNTRIDFPYVLVGDEAFPLKDYLMRPYPKEVLDDAKRIFGYRLSRARRTIENVFGICSSRFRVLRKPIIGDVKNVISITKAVVSLHNYLINETRYISGPMEEGMAGDQNLQESFLPFRQVDSNNSTKTAKQIREMLVDYFVSDAGRVTWQNETIQSTLHNFDKDFV